jgi:Lon protease-like protein
MFPLGLVVFPEQVVALVVFEQRYHDMLRAIEGSRQFGTCLISHGSEVGGGDERTSVGTLLEIVEAHELPAGQTLLHARGIECFTISQWLEDDPYPRAMVDERCCDDVRIEVPLLKSTESAVKALRTLRSECHPDENVSTNLELDNYDPWLRAWQLSALTPMDLHEQFSILAESNPNDRLRLLLEICCETYGRYQQQLCESAD